MTRPGGSTIPSPSALARPVAVLCAGFFLVGCPAKIEDRRMGETIRMAAFEFEIDGTAEEFRRSDKVITVRLLLDRDKSVPFRMPFGESFVGKIHIVDGAGNRFESGLVVPLSGDHLTAIEWQTGFVISSNAYGVRDKEKLGDGARDFRLIIKNPDPRAGQPRKVSIALD